MHDTRHHDERGQALSSFVVVVVVALLLVAGLVIDGGRLTAADRRAELSAAAAARAAADATAAQRQAGRGADPGTAIAAARQVLSAEGLTGNVSLAGDGTVRVDVTTSVETVLLSLIGIDRLDGHGTASAQLFDQER